MGIEPKNEEIKARVAGSVKNQIRSVAHAMDLDISDIMRMAIRDWLRREVSSVKAVK